MTIHGSMVRLTATGEFKSVVACHIAEADWTSIPLPDWDEPMTWSMSLTMKEVNLGALALVFGSRRVFGWSRKLAINGHEYHRRRRSR